MKRTGILAAVLLLILAAVPALAEYDRILPSEKGPYQWAQKDGYWYFLNESGAAFPGYRWTDEDFNLSTNMLYDQLPDGRIALCFGSAARGKWGIIDAGGNIVAEPVYDRIDDFAGDGLLAVKDGKTGVIDSDGNVLIGFQYEAIGYYEDCAIHPFRLPDGKWGYMDEEGNHVIAAQYDDVCLMNTWAAVRVGDLWGMIDPQGSWIFEPQFDEYQSISKDCAVVLKNGKYGVAALDGTMICEAVYDSIQGFGSNGLSAVCLHGLWGYMGTDGRWAIEPQFESVSGFHPDGFAIVKTGGKYGMIDASARWLIEPVWEEIHTSGNCAVSKFGTWIYTEEAYHAVQGDREYYFDVIDGEVVPGGEGEAWG